MDYLSKELIRTYSFSTRQYGADYTAKEFKFNGRTYMKYGELQEVTFVGNLYKVFDPSINRNKYMLMIGLAKQHPCDLSTSREEGLDIANTHAHENPSIVMEVQKTFDDEMFLQFCCTYASMMRRAFIKTRQEIAEMKKILGSPNER